MQGLQPMDIFHGLLIKALDPRRMILVQVANRSSSDTAASIPLTAFKLKAATAVTDCRTATCHTSAGAWILGYPHCIPYCEQRATGKSEVELWQ